MRPKAERGRGLRLGHQTTALGLGTVGGKEVCCSDQVASECPQEGKYLEPTLTSRAGSPGLATPLTIRHP